MEEIQLDYATLVSVYQTKISELTNQIIIAEAKNIILTKKIQEMFESKSDSYDSPTVTAPASRKKAAGADS